MAWWTAAPSRRCTRCITHVRGACCVHLNGAESHAPDRDVTAAFGGEDIVQLQTRAREICSNGSESSRLLLKTAADKQCSGLEIVYHAVETHLRRDEMPLGRVSEKSYCCESAFCNYSSSLQLSS